jgi:hypothetical protein
LAIAAAAGHRRIAITQLAGTLNSVAALSMRGLVGRLDDAEEDTIAGNLIDVPSVFSWPCRQVLAGR